MIELHLKDLSYEVDLSFDGPQGLAKSETGDYDLIILDLMLPGLDGLEICRRLRNDSVYTPILMLTSKSSELDRVLGLEMGADDYVVKPFSIRELMARVKAIFRRVERLKSDISTDDLEMIRKGDLVIDPLKRVLQLFRLECLHLVFRHCLEFLVPEFPRHTDSSSASIVVDWFQHTEIRKGIYPIKIWKHST